MTHFLLKPIFTRVKVKNKNLIKRNLPRPVGSAERNFLEHINKFSIMHLIDGAIKRKK